MVHSISNLLLLLTVCLCTACSPNTDKLMPKAVHGIVDLQHWDFEKQGVLDISGELTFYWKPPIKIGEKLAPNLTHDYIEVTKTWNKQPSKYISYPQNGYAVYSLQILLPKIDDHELAFEIFESSAVKSFYINGKLLGSNSLLSLDTLNTSLGTKPGVFHFRTTQDTLQLDIWASNYKILKSGLGKPIRFGLAASLEKKWHQNLSIALFLMGSILMMAFYHIGLFILRKEDFSSLYFGLFALILGIRILSNGHFFINEFIELSGSLIKKIDYTFYYLSLGLITSFLRELFPHEFPKWSKQTMLFTSISASLFMYLTPFEIGQYSLFPFQMLSLLFGSLSTFALSVALFRRRQSAAIFLIGFVVLFATGVNDILFSMDIINTAHLIPFGIFSFIFAQAFLLSARFTDAYNRSQQLSIALDASNHELETRVKQRTASLKQANTELEKLSMVANKIDNGVVIMDPSGKIEWVNSGFTQLTGFSLKDLYDTYGLDISAFSAQKNILHFIEACITDKQTLMYDAQTTKKGGGQIWLHTTLTPIFNDNEQVVKLIAVDTDISKVKLAEAEIQQQKTEIEQQRDQVTRHRDEIEKKNKRITDSLLYARNIQRAIMPNEQQLKNIYKDAFVLNLPKDIVSGDFYWIAERGEHLIIAVADCTGHGVPGAFMSSLGITFLNEIVNEHELPTPGQMLTKLRDKIKSALRQNSDTINKRDGIDMALCSINRNSLVAQFAGAYNPLWIIRNKDLHIHKGDRMPVGDYHRDNIQFKTNEIQLYPNDCLYMFSDGYVDQFYQGQLVKLNTKRLKKLLLEMHDLPFSQQKESLLDAFNQWKGRDFIQIDDVLILGFKI